MKKTQRWLCLLLVLCMLLSVMPVTAMAAEPGAEAGTALYQEDAEAGADVLAAPQSVGEAGPNHGDLIYENDFSGEDPIRGWTNKLPYVCQEGTLQGTTATSGGLILAGQPTGVANYVVSATTRILTEETSEKSNDGHSAGIVFQASAENTFYHLRLDRSANNGDSLQLYRWNSSGPAQIKSTAFRWTTGDTYTLAAVIMGSTIQAYVNGVSIFRVTVETPLPAGRVGFRVYNCTAAFDDLKVWQLPAAQVEITSPAEGASLSTGSVTIMGTTTGAASASIAFDAAAPLPLTLEADGSFSYAAALPNGAHTVTVTAVYPNGTPVTASRSFTVNVQEPAAALDPSGDGEETLTLNGDWYFKTDPANAGIAGQWFNLSDPSGWDVLPVPGNWDLENAYANYKGTAWYARSFTVDEAYRNYPIYLSMTAAYRNCTIWINGAQVGTHAGGYTTFEFRIDQFLHYGADANTIAVKLDNTSRDLGAWWKWGGVSGGASLKIRNTAKLDWQHIVSTPDLAAKTAELNITYRMDNASNAEKRYTLVTEVVDRQTNSPVGTVRTAVTLAAMQNDQTASAQLHLENIKLWHFDDPSLYTVKTWLKDGEQTIHYVEDDIGIRKIEIRDCKFYLNGEQLRLTGANRVWDDRVNGQTEPDYLVMRDIDYMKSMGMNCARMSHVPMTKNILDYCDQVGFLLICEGNNWGGPPAKVGDSYECVPW